MATWVNLDGTILPADEARISVFDRGFLYGDSVYEVLRTADGWPVFWPEHWARLCGSARLLDLDPGIAADVLEARIAATAARLRPDESYVRLIVTRGVGALSLDPGAAAGPPCHVIIAKPLPALDPTLYEEGCVLATFAVDPRTEVDARAKSGMKRSAVLAQAHATARGAYEALRVTADGQVLEGASSTFFLVRDGEVLTPPLDGHILAGITRGKVLELGAQAGVAIRERSLRIEDLASAQEAFITSTIRGLVPVRRIDDRDYGPPGPVTRELRRAYLSMMSRVGSDHRNSTSA